MAAIFEKLPTKVLLAGLGVALLSSCAPPPPSMNAASTIDLQTISTPHDRSEDTCAIYRATFGASVIAPLKSLYDDPRLSMRTEAGDATPAEVRAIRASLVAAQRDSEWPWTAISDDVLIRAFQSWRTGPLPDCDWMGFAREVSAPARHGRIAEVLIADETAPYTRVSRPFFVDPDTAIFVVREVIDDAPGVRRRLVVTYRDNGGWLMVPFTVEEREGPAR